MFQLVKFLFKFLFKSFPLLQEVVSLKSLSRERYSSDATKEVEEIVDVQKAIGNAREKVEMETKQFRQDLEKAYRDKVYYTVHAMSMPGLLCQCLFLKKPIIDFICIL